MEEIYLSGEEDIDVNNDDSDIEESSDIIRDLTAFPPASSTSTAAAAAAAAQRGRRKTRTRSAAANGSAGQHAQEDEEDGDDEDEDEDDEELLAALDAEAEPLRQSSDRLKLLALLPYPITSLAEMDALVEHALLRLQQCIYLKDREAGMLLWHERLVWLCQSRYPLKPSVHIRLVKIYYHFACLPTAPGAEAATSECCRVCIFLLSSHKLKPEYLKLPWRPLYNRFYREKYPSARQRDLLGVGCSDTLNAYYEELAVAAQRFFAVEGPAGERVVENMLAVILAKLDGTDPTWSRLAFEMATYFLPKRLAYKWFQPMFRLWQTIISAAVTRKWYRVLGTIANFYSRDIIKDPLPITKEGARNVGFFTEQHYRIIMNALLKEISGGSRNADDSGLSLVEESKIALQYLAHVVVSSLEADQPDGGSSALSFFNTFLTAVEHKFHPLSGGVGQLQVSCLTHYLLSALVNRAFLERRPECTVPARKRLTKRIIDELTERLGGLVLMALFSKQTEAADACQGALLKIATLRPDLAIPQLLERSFQSLQALETSERTQPIMKCLSLLAIPMLRRSHFKGAAQHLLPLLHLCLPGIDPNDPYKTINTGLLTVMLVHGVQIEDLTRAELHDAPASPIAERANASAMGGGTEMMLDGEAAPEAVPDPTEGETDEAIRSSTESAEDWVVQFFRRTLTVFTSLAEEGAKGQSAWETEVQAATALISAASYLCQSLSSRLFDVALDVIADFAASSPAANCVKQIGQLVFAFARVDAEKVLARLLPICDQRIRYELGTGAGASFSTSTTSTAIGDVALHWALSVLGGAVSGAGPALLAHRETLVSLLAHAAEGCKAERAYYLLSRVLVKALVSLSTVYPSEERFVGPKEWDSADFRRNSFRYWGKTYAPGEAEVSWHVPSEAEIQFVLELVDRFGNALLDDVAVLLQAPVEQRGIVWSNSFCRKLTLARAVFTGIPALIELPKVYDGLDVADMDSEVLDFYRSWTPIQAHFSLRDESDKRYQRVLAFRRKFATTVTEAGERLQQAGGDEHLDDSRVVLKCISSALLSYAFTEELHSPTSYCDTYLLGASKLEQGQKAYPRIWWIRMAYRHHKSLQRLRAIRRRRTAIDDGLLKQLINFTQSEYRSIRIRSQTIVESLSTNYSGVRTMTMPVILDALQVSAPKHRIKAAIYLMSLDTFSTWLTFHAKFLPAVWDALISLQAHPDHKVQELAADAADSAFTSCGTDTISFLNVDLGPYLSKTSARIVQKHPEDKELLERVHADIHRRAATQAEIYTKLRTGALQVLADEKAHWTFVVAAIVLLGLLDRVYEPVQADIATEMARFCTDPNPELRALASQLLSRLLYYVKIRTLAPSTAALAEYRKQQPLAHAEVRALPVAAEAIEERLQSFRGELGVESKLEESSLQDVWLVPEQRSVFFRVRTGPALEWDETSRDAVEGLREIVTSEEWWTLFLQRNAEDKEKTSMSSLRISLCKALAEIYGTAVTGPLTKAVEAVIAEDASDRANHRAAGEAIVGLLRGIKNWKLEEQVEAHAWFRTFAPPLFKTLSSECADVWRMSLSMIIGNRDPRRNRFIIDFVLEQLKALSRSDEESAWEQNKAHYMTSGMLYALGGKSHAWVPDLNAAVQPKLQADYVAVASTVGKTLAEADMVLAAPKFSGVQALLEASDSGFGTLIDIKARLRSRLEDMFAQLETLLPSRTPPAHGTMSPADRLAFAIISWASKILDDHRHADLQSVLLDFAPHFQRLFELRDNRELSGAALGMIVRVSQPPHIGESLDVGVERLIEVYSSAESWQTRIGLLAVLNMAFLRHAFLCSVKVAERVLDTTVKALQDDHVDVRTAAGRELTLLVMQHHREAIPRLIKLFERQTNETLLPHKSDPRYGEALRKLHGALLGAGALVSAFPTSVPDWMGGLIVNTLALHDEDPAPIGPAVRKVATQFKETHEMYREGAWDEHATHFSEDELAVVHDWTLGRAADYIA
ncbi:Proteasome activator BLM10 [Tilletia horrida]|nr:Proteasome activator BLM10 [Tilletia horrida]